jgi:hypothetical protein
VFQHSCSSSRVPAFVFQQSCFSIRVRICVAASVVFVFVLQHLCSCFSNCVPASAIVFQLLCSNTCACSITNRLSSMTTLTICVSFCVPALFQHCVSASVFAFVLQQFAFVLQRLCLHLCCSSSHLCCSVCVCICVAASVFQLLCSYICSPYTIDCHQ